MAREPSPAFQFYPRDWLSAASVVQMTPEQRGLYIQLLSHGWLEGSLPADDAAVAALAGCSLKRWQAVGGFVRQQFEERDGRLYQGRLERERRKQMEYREDASEHGKKGARARWKGPPEQCSSNARASSEQCPPMALQISDLRSQISSSGTPPAFPRVARGPHGNHATCGRVCVPDFIHEDLRLRLGGAEDVADLRLRVWYGEILDAIPDDASIPTEPVKFWRAQFEVWQKPNAMAASTAAADKALVDEGLRILAARKAMR